MSIQQQNNTCFNIMLYEILWHFLQSKSYCIFKDEHAMGPDARQEAKYQEESTEEPQVWWYLGKLKHSRPVK